MLQGQGCHICYNYKPRVVTFDGTRSGPGPSLVTRLGLSHVTFWRGRKLRTEICHVLRLRLSHDIAPGLRFVTGSYSGVACYGLGGAVTCYGARSTQGDMETHTHKHTHTCYNSGAGTNYGPKFVTCYGLGCHMIFGQGCDLLQVRTMGLHVTGLAGLSHVSEPGARKATYGNTHTHTHTHTCYSSGAGTNYGPTFVTC